MKTIAFKTTLNFICTSIEVLLEYALLRIIAKLLLSLQNPLPYFSLFLITAPAFLLCGFYARTLRILNSLELTQQLRGKILDSCLFLNNKNSYKHIIIGLNKDTETVAAFYETKLPIFISNIVLYAIVLFFLFRTNVIAAFCIAGISCLCCIPDIILRKYFMQTYWDTRAVEEKLSNYFLEAFNLNTIINLYRVHLWFFKRFHTITDEFYTLGNKAELFAKLEDFLHSFSEVIITLLSYLLIAYFKTKEMISTEQAIGIAVLLPLFFSRTVTAFSIIGIKNNFTVSKKRLQSITQEKKQEETNDIITGIEYKSVVPSYLKEKIAPVSFSIFSNDRILIKGENGIGKTSLLQCLFCSIEFDGTIEIKTGNGIKENTAISQSSFIKNFIYLPQEFPLLSLTAEEFINAVSAENDIDIHTLKQKFRNYGFNFEKSAHTKIENLSGGEKKKLLLPAAFSLHKILILDEPTNDLDAAGIAALKNDLLHHDKAVIVISHDADIDSCFSKIITIGA